MRKKKKVKRGERILKQIGNTACAYEKGFEAGESLNETISLTWMSWMIAKLERLGTKARI